MGEPGPGVGGGGGSSGGLLSRTYGRRLVVIIGVMIVALYLGVVDFVLSWMVHQALR